MVKKDYRSWSKEDLIKEVEALKKQKTYGLVWEKDKTQEAFDYYINWDGQKTEEKFPGTEHKLPVLKEVSDKEILTDKNKDSNLLIEGDNYHALATLNFTHNKSVDVIYIDPPYNTGKKNEWKYNDSYVDAEDAYRHSKWLSFMEKRLKLARELLSDSGVLFISIDDNELAQLKILCDEIFGENNRLETFIWNTEGNIDNQRKIRNNHEYILAYAKKEENFKSPQIIDPNIAKESKLYRDYIENSITKNGPKNPISEVTLPKGFPCAMKEGIIDKDSTDYPKKTVPIKVKDYKTTRDVKVSSGWSCKELLEEFIKNNCKPILDSKGQETKFVLTSTGAIYVYKERQKTQGHVLSVLRNFGTTKQMSNYLLKSGLKFDYPKPINLIKYLISIHNDKEATVLDFFAGSGTTGQAVLEVNKLDGGNRNFILCTNNENNICTEVCYPRVKKVIEGYKTSEGGKIEGLGGNLKYYRTDFVDSAPTDKNKKKIVDKSTEMICIKENAFIPIKGNKEWKIFKNHDYYLGIIFDEDSIEDFVKEAKKLDKKIHIYVFSLDETVPEREFKELKNKAKLCPIPEVILHVYRRIFK